LLNLPFYLVHWIEKELESELVVSFGKALPQWISEQNDLYPGAEERWMGCNQCLGSFAFNKQGTINTAKVNIVNFTI
jgi:hypothetical protein